MKAAALALVVLLAGTPAARASEQDRLHTNLGSLPAFSLTDQAGNAVGREQLAGKVCIFSFYFSCCTSMCPKTQETMGKLQERLSGLDDVLLVSVNVYPEHDTAEIIDRYARDHNARPGRWLFLRGSKSEVDALVQGGFKQALVLDPEGKPGYEVTHSPNFMIVDHRGIIRGYANGLDPDEVDQAEGVVRRLVQAKYFPSINAALNGACGILLVLGYICIRRRWITAHKCAMLLALAVSAVFLGCYLYYHFVVLDGQPTRFSVEGAVRYLYLGILLSHTLLAVAVAPLALTVTYFGLRDRLARHTRLARFTLPMWLYVSVTGVVVYWMLYHLYPPA
jgi:protein SCO1